jgi:hypothetical protein
MGIGAKRRKEKGERNKEKGTRRKEKGERKNFLLSVFLVPCSLNSFSFLLFSFLLFSLLSCSEEEKEEPAGRTVLIYISADNSLSEYAYANLDGILKGASEANLNNGRLLVYIDAADDVPQLFRIQKDRNGLANTQLLHSYPEQNSASSEVMHSVLDEVFSEDAYHSDSYGLLLWSHGTAWLPFDTKNYLRSFGEDHGNSMTVNELKDALEDYRFDFIIFDACYMAGIEMVYALRERANYILASPTEILGEGFPYSQIIKHLFSPLPVSQALVNIGDAFYRFYDEQQGGSGIPRSASISLIKTEYLSQLARLWREIRLESAKGEEFAPVSEFQFLEHLYPVYHALYDLGDYTAWMASGEQYVRFQELMDDVVVFKAITSISYYNKGGSFAVDREHFSGLSVYVPQEQLPELNECYKNQEWYKFVYE